MLPPLTPQLHSYISERREKHYTSLSGDNNCGKSLMLKRLVGQTPAHAGYLLTCSRFYQFEAIDQVQTDFRNQRNMYGGSGINFDRNLLTLEQLIPRLTDAGRELLFRLCGQVVGGQFSMKFREPSNQLSSAFVEVDGRHVMATSSGTRLVMMLLGLCCDSSFATLMIDEPEIGLSPKTQTCIARYLMDKELRSKLFPHLKQVFVATHSHLFLDRTEISNNYIVSQIANPDPHPTSGPTTMLSLSPVTTVAEFHHLQFNMLGNDLESMFLPSAIVVVEGESDATVIGRMFQLRYPDKRISVVSADTESAMPYFIGVFNKFLGNIAATTPYRSRLFILLDSVHSMGSNGTVAKLKGLGIAESNIVVLQKNGIEYYYPPEILTKIFGCSSDQLPNLTIVDNQVSLNEHKFKKSDVARKVADQLTAESKFGEECEDFFRRVAMATES